MKLLEYPSIPCKKSKKQIICESRAEKIKQDKENGMRIVVIMKKYDICDRTIYRIIDPEKKKIYDERVKARNYWKYHNDPEFRRKQIERCGKNHRERYKNDPKYHAWCNQMIHISAAKRLFKKSK